MATAKSRVTNGHRAAVCGLILAGVPFVAASRIVGVHHERIRPYIPDDFVKILRLPKPATDRERKLYRKLQAHLGQHRAAAHVFGSP